MSVALQTGISVKNMKMPAPSPTTSPAVDTAGCLAKAIGALEKGHVESAFGIRENVLRLLANNQASARGVQTAKSNTGEDEFPLPFDKVIAAGDMQQKNNVRSAMRAYHYVAIYDKDPTRAKGAVDKLNALGDEWRSRNPKIAICAFDYARNREQLLAMAAELTGRKLFSLAYQALCAARDDGKLREFAEVCMKDHTTLKFAASAFEQLHDKERMAAAGLEMEKANMLDPAKAVLEKAVEMARRETIFKLSQGTGRLAGADEIGKDPFVKEYNNILEEFLGRHPGGVLGAEARYLASFAKDREWRQRTGAYRFGTDKAA